MQTNHLNIVVVGAGYWGKNLVRNFYELGVLAGVCDPDVAQAEKLAQQYSSKIYTWQALLQDETVQAVAIAAPAALHADLAQQALLANKHVFVEKPLALQVNEAKTLSQLAQEKHLTLMVGHLLQYHPAFLKLKSLVHDGKLGRLQYLYSNRLNLGKIRREEDILWSFAPHDISMILSLVGSEPEHVQAVGGYYLHNKIADVTMTHLTFPGGEQAHIHVSWIHPYKEQKLVVIGDRGMMVFDDGQDWADKLLFYPHQIQWQAGQPIPSKAEAEPVSLDEYEPLRAECEHYIHCVLNKTKPITDGEEGVRVLRVLQAASQTLEQAKSITVTPQKVNNDIRVHSSAYVDENVILGKGSKVWHFSHILGNTTIGENCIIGQNVMVGPDVVVGNNCKIQNNVSLYKGIVLEDEVFCGPSCVFTNVNTPRANIERKNEFKTTHVGRGATIGANATIICGVTLGEYCFIGAGAVVTKSIKPHALVVGNPAKQIGWVSHAGEPLDDNLICPRQGRRYQVNDGNLQEVSVTENDTLTV
jgi:UDP-2-acetamido-3-amino-2,3-dideoxy-glucuronate N-acetyltransferase